MHNGITSYMSIDRAQQTQRWGREGTQYNIIILNPIQALKFGIGHCGVYGVAENKNNFQRFGSRCIYAFSHPTITNYNRKMGKSS